MKKTLIFSLILSCISVGMKAQSNLNMTLLANWNDPDLPLASPGNLNVRFSGCWGLAVNGREIAVIGGAKDILFFDVTTPTNPQLLQKFRVGDTSTVNREMKSYKNRIYTVSEGPAAEGLMIFDLSDAPNIKKSYQSTEFMMRGHSLTLDTISGHLYINGGSAGNGVIVLDASANPDKPVFLAHPNLDPDLGGYVHDAYVRNDTLYCSSGWEGYYVIDFHDPVNPKLVANCVTGGYNHNSWLTRDGKYAYYTEEVPKGRPIRVIDLSKLNTEGEIEPVNSFLDNLLFPDLPDSTKLAIPHNVYMRDKLLFDSQYEDGLLVYELSDPLHPKLVAHFDTHPENTVYNGYFGNWGNYPWFPSGTIIAGDMQNGLFVLKLDIPLPTKNPELLAVQISPNPASDNFSLSLPESEAENWSYRLTNAQGQLSRTGEMNNQRTATVNVSNLASGIYFLETSSKSGLRNVSKIIVRN